MFMYFNEAKLDFGEIKNELRFNPNLQCYNNIVGEKDVLAYGMEIYVFLTTKKKTKMEWLGYLSGRKIAGKFRIYLYQGCNGFLVWFAPAHRYRVRKVQDAFFYHHAGKLLTSLPVGIG